MPLVKAKALTEESGGQNGNQAQKSQGGAKSQGQGKSNGQGGTQSQGKSGEQGQEEKVFSAGETALFVDGKAVGKLNETESFTYALIKNQLRLAAYSLPYDGKTYTLTVKRSSPSLSLQIDEKSLLQVEIKMAMGISDVSKAQSLEDTVDVGDFPKELLGVAAENIEKEIFALFEKCRAIGFDLFEAIDKLQKYENEHFADKKDTLLQELEISVRVQASSIR